MSLINNVRICLLAFEQPFVLDDGLLIIITIVILMCVIFIHVYFFFQSEKAMALDHDKTKAMRPFQRIWDTGEEGHLKIRTGKQGKQRQFRGWEWGVGVGGGAGCRMQNIEHRDFYFGTRRRK